MRNKGAFFGLIVICAAIVVAIVAYFIAPDPSPDANRIVLEIGGRKPGFRQLFLLVKKEMPPAPVSFFHRLADGREDVYDYVPINSYSVKGDSVIAEKFVDEGVEERRSWPLARLVAKPGGRVSVREQTFWLGTDKYGRDMLSRLLIGVRVSLAVGMVTVLLSLTVGVLLGALAGYFRGRVDEVILWFVNVIWSIPTLLLVFAIMLVLGKGFWQVFVAIGLTLWVNVARIVRGQVLVARDALDDWPSGAPGRSVTNVVMMGMGEPLYNFDNVKAALSIVTDGDALALSKRRVTLSTAGVVPMIPRAGEEIGSSLAISLHAVRDEIRDVIVPINKKYPLEELLGACRTYPGVSNARRITFEYVMLKGVNDSLADARELVKIIRGIPAKINLIPFNPWPGAPYECSDWTQIEKFAEIVNRAGYASPVRTPRGRDIMAACGQLKSESVKQRASERMAEMRSAELARMPS